MSSSIVFRCECDKGYTGKNCRDYYYPCDPSPCENGGRCSDVGKYDFKCSCPAGKTCKEMRSTSVPS